jgi:hypothetical protein
MRKLLWPSSKENIGIREEKMAGHLVKRLFLLLRGFTFLEVPWLSHITFM